MNLIKPVILALFLTIFTQGLLVKPILAQNAQYPELQEYKKLCFNHPLTCQDIAKAAEMASKIVYESAEMNDRLASCPWFYDSCDAVSVQIIDNTITNEQILRLLGNALEPIDAENQLKVRINVDNLLESFNRLGGYALVLKQQTVQDNGRTKLSYIITFKGTSPDRINDLFSNAYVRATELSEKNPNIRVHSGFRQYAQTVAIATQAKIQEMLTAQQDPNIDLEVLVTGHSLGGAAATVYGLLLNDRGVLPENLKIITFAAPAFVRKDSEASLIETYGKLNLIAIENRGDIILDSVLFQEGYKLNSYVFPSIRNLVEGNLSRSLENLYKQREVLLQQPESTIFTEESPNNSQQVTVESKIKLEQLKIHMDSYNQYYEYYLDVLKSDREFNRYLTDVREHEFPRSMTEETNQNTSQPITTNFDPNYTLTNTLSSEAGGIGIHPLAMTSDGQTLISGSEDGSLTFWSVPNGKQIARLSAHSQPITALEIGVNSKVLVSGSKNGNITIWDMTNRQQIYNISGDSYPINALAISPNGEVLVTGHGNGTVKIWNLTTGEEIRTIYAHSQAVNSLVFSPNGQILASGSGNEIIKLWHLETGEMIPNHRRRTGKVWAIAQRNEGEFLVISSFDKNIKIWDLYSGEELRSLSDNSGTIWTVTIPRQHGDSLLNTNQPFFLYSGSWNGQIKVWSFSTGGEIYTQSGDSRPVTDLVLSPDGQTLVSSSWDGKIRIWQK